MEDIKAKIMGVPPLVRYWCGGTFLLSFCMTYKILTPYSLLLYLPDAFTKLEVWRLITTFFFAGPFSMNFLFTMWMLYFGASKIEVHFE